MKSPNKSVERMAAGRRLSQYRTRWAAAIAHFRRWPYMSKTHLHAVNPEGKQVLEELLAPMFSTLEPGFSAAADELRWEADHSAEPHFDVRCSYRCADRYTPLPVHPEFHPWIASSRMRILCGMSIRPDVSEQAGSLRVRVDGRVVAVAVRITVEGSREIVSFSPIWQPPPNGQPTAARERRDYAVVSCRALLARRR